MEIAKNSIVSIDYTLTSNEGNVLDSSNGREPLAYLHGARNIIPGLEAALDGKAVGDQVKVTVPPDQAYGERDPQMIQAVARSAFGKVEPAAGMQFQANTSAGPRVVTIVKVDGDDVTIDANHPLAGMTLNFDVKVVAVRQATQEELDHGHVHGPEGHGHDEGHDHGH